MSAIHERVQAHDHILVTGGAGFIGSHLVERLVMLGARVTVVDNLATGRLTNLRDVGDRIEFCQADLGQLLKEHRLDVEHYAFIFHLAANPYIPPSIENPAYDYENNLRNTFWLLEALRLAGHRPRLINVSSAAVYGNPATLPIEETDPTVPISPYGVSKLAAERYVAVFSQLYGLPALSLRLFSVYGPRQRKQVVFDFLTRLRAQPRRLEVIGDGTQARDFTFVGDVVEAMWLAASQAPARGEVYNVATGTTHSIAELVAAVCRIEQVEPEIVYTGKVRPGDAQAWEVNIARLRQLGFAPATTLDIGLRAVKTWYDTLAD